MAIPQVTAVPTVAAPGFPTAPAPPAEVPLVEPAAEPALPNATPEEKKIIDVIWGFFAQIVEMLRKIGSGGKTPAAEPAIDPATGLPAATPAAAPMASKGVVPATAASGDAVVEVEATETVAIADMTTEQKKDVISQFQDMLWAIWDALDKMGIKKAIPNPAETLQELIDTTPITAGKGRFGEKSAIVASKPAVSAAGYDAVPIKDETPNFGDRNWWANAKPLENRKDAEAIVGFMASKGSVGSFNLEEIEAVRKIYARTMKEGGK